MSVSGSGNAGVNPIDTIGVGGAGRERLIWLLDQIEGELYLKGGADVLRDAREQALRDADMVFPPRRGAEAVPETMDHLRLRLQILTQRLDHL